MDTYGGKDAYGGGADAPPGSDGRPADRERPPAPDAAPTPEPGQDAVRATPPGADGAPATPAPSVAEGAPAASAPPTPEIPAPPPAPATPATPAATPPPATPDATPPPAAPRTGVAALSPRYQIGAALALAAVAVAVCVHIGMVFLHVAPANTVSRAHGTVVDEWIYPEFEQNWKLFAPNPLQQNIAVEVRAEIRTAGGEVRTTDWYGLSAQDGRDIQGNPLPSHTQQNELRRAWDFFTASHTADNRPVGLRGTLAETYLRRIAVLRLDRAGLTGDGGTVERVQFRSRTTPVPPPRWSGEQVSLKPVLRELPWWTVSQDEARGGAR
ncbi:DUF5819 family protein [Streptomyces sp. NPDC057413]|uniref:DUF5819 family protein n=1 Tax=Streptomyces sp. NPDC057413 TaxID=3346124 RepID=UPI0036BC145D